MATDNTLIIKINGSAKNFLDELDKVKKATKETEKILSKTAKVAGAAFLALAGTIAAVTKSYANYETALVGVGKTTNITGKSLKNFGAQVQGLSKRIPVATNDLLGIAQAAGQLGVKGEKNLLLFTETVAKLGVATDLTGETAAVALAKLLNVTGESISEIARLGSVIVRLGNNTAASESKIVRMTSEVGKSTAQFKIGTTNAAALGASLAELGQQAQLGGSVVGRSFRQIDKIIRAGGEGVKNLTALTGLNGEQLKRTFKTDANEVFSLFLQGLRRVEKGNGSITETLKLLGLEGDEVNKVLPVLAVNFDKVAKNQALANDEAIKQTALNKEAAAAFDTLNSEIQLTKNSLITFSQVMGERFAKDASELLAGIRDIVNGLNDLDEGTKDNLATFIKFITVLTGIVAALALGGLAITKAIVAWQGLALAFAAIKTVAVAVGVAMSGLALPLVAIAAVAGAAAFGIKKLIDASNESTKLPEDLQAVNAELAKQKKVVEDLIKIQKELGKEEDEESKRFLKIQKDKLAALEAQKKKLQELSGFGTGELLIRPKASNDPLDFNLPGEAPRDVNVPLAADPSAREAEVEAELAAIKAAEVKKGEVLDFAASERVAKRKAEQEKIKDLTFLQAAQESDSLTSSQKDLLAKEFEFAQQRRDLKLEEIAAQSIESEKERAVALENVALKGMQIAQAEAVFTEQKRDTEARELERQKVLNEELRALTLEERAALTEEDLALLRDKLQTEGEVEREAARNKVAENVAKRKREAADTKEHGKVLASLKAIFNTKEVKGVQSVTSDLAQLRQSSSKKQQKIGKAAAKINAAIQTANGAISAYASLSGIPIVGPVLGAAAAGALLVFGLEQQRNIDRAGAQGGGQLGLVPNSAGAGGSRDRIDASLEPGEVVVPKRLVPDFVQSFGRPEGGGGDNVPTVGLEITLSDNAFDVIEARRQESVALGLIEG